jgi:hypothetical protein
MGKHDGKASHSRMTAYYVCYMHAESYLLLKKLISKLLHTLNATCNRDGIQVGSANLNRGVRLKGHIQSCS